MSIGPLPKTWYAALALAESLEADPRRLVTIAEHQEESARLGDQRDVAIRADQWGSARRREAEALIVEGDPHRGGGRRGSGRAEDSHLSLDGSCVIGHDANPIGSAPAGTSLMVAAALSGRL